MSDALVDLEAPVPVQPRVRPGPAGGDPRRPERRAVRHRALAVLLRPAEPEPARLLGHGRRPAVQDPQQREHPGRGAAAAAVRPAARPRHAGRGGRGRHRHRQHRQRPEPAARPGALAAADPEGAGARRRGALARAARCWPRWRRATPSSWRCCARGHEIAAAADDPERALPAVAARPGDHQRAAADRATPPSSATPTTCACSAWPRTRPTVPPDLHRRTAASSPRRTSPTPTARWSASTTCDRDPGLQPAAAGPGHLAVRPVRRDRRGPALPEQQRGRRAQHAPADGARRSASPRTSPTPSPPASDPDSRAPKRIWHFWGLGAHSKVFGGDVLGRHRQDRRRHRRASSRPGTRTRPGWPRGPPATSGGPTSGRCRPTSPRAS